MYGREERCMQGFGGETIWKAQAQMEDNFKVDLKEISWKGMDWIDLTGDRDRWQAVISMIKNLYVA